jgi:hypothetical protein
MKKFQLPKWNIFKKLGLKVWYFINYTIQPKEIFVRKLNRRIPGWVIGVFKDKSGKAVFCLTPVTQGPLSGDDMMFINDPVISIDDVENAHYDFNGGFNPGDGKRYLPGPREWKKIWDNAIATYLYILNNPKYDGKNEASCPDCKGQYSFETGLTKKGHLCPTCFGLGTIFTYGPQEKFGKILLDGSDIIIEDRRNTIKFSPTGLKALIDLYHTYSTGIVTDIAQDYLVWHCHEVLQQVFPDVVIYKTEDQIPEDGWSESFYGADGVFTYRHLYAKKGKEYVNLFSGKVETPSHAPVLADLPDDTPGRDRWNLCIDLLYTLCVFDAAE